MKGGGVVVLYSFRYKRLIQCNRLGLVRFTYSSTHTNLLAFRLHIIELSALDFQVCCRSLQQVVSELGLGLLESRIDLLKGSFVRCSS